MVVGDHMWMKTTYMKYSNLLIRMFSGEAAMLHIKNDHFRVFDDGNDILLVYLDLISAPTLSIMRFYLSDLRNKLI